MAQKIPVYQSLCKDIPHLPNDPHFTRIGYASEARNLYYWLLNLPEFQLARNAVRMRKE